MVRLLSSPFAVSLGIGACIFSNQNNIGVSAQSISKILDTIYEQTSGEDWTDQSGWKDAYRNSFCFGWAGIECYDVEDGDELYGHIETIDLSNNNLKGTLPPEIFSIPHIQHIILRDNSDLTIKFDGIGRATTLKRFIVSRSHIENFDGLESVGNTLEELHITGCGYDGELPASMMQLSKLKGLYANFNNFKGSIPQNIRDMQSLEELYLFENALTGSIPAQIEELTKLRVLVLSNNWLTGEIPQSFDTMPNLKIISLANNDLKGNLPAFSGLEKLTQLYLQNNNLQGIVKGDFLFDAPKHEQVIVDLSYNQLSGTLEAARLSEFEYLDIYVEGNKFVGIDPNLCEKREWMNRDVNSYGCNAIMCPIGYFAPRGRETSDDEICQQCDSNTLGLKYMGANDCGNEQKTILKGLYDAMNGENWEENNWVDEPDECLWTGVDCDDDGYVTEIRLAGMGLTGTPPAQIFNLPELMALDLSENFIKFSFDGISTAGNLRELNLFSTGLDSLENIEQLEETSLTSLVLSSNNIDSTIPDVIWRLTDLQELAISHNNFRGTISHHIGNLINLEIFHAYGNELSGAIPSTIGNLQNSLKNLVLSENDFTGEIPDEMSEMYALETFSMHQTTNTQGGLTGTLPDFAECYYLSTLHLSGNSIEGELPEYFLEESKVLEDDIELDLSSNYFVGSIPSSWAKFRSLNVDLSNNKIDHIPHALCSKNHWQYGFVGDSNGDSCDAILCPTGSYNAGGRATRSTPCTQCSSAEFFGTTFCENDNTDNLAILESLYASTHGGNWDRNDGWFTSNDVCNGWYGIFCDDDGIDIVRIDLSKNSLTGTPSNEIFKLPQLQELQLQDNKIGFSFDGIEAAAKLETLYLSQTLVSSLEGIGRATSLKILHVTECHLSGPIPTELFNLVSLEALYMNYNKFTGRISQNIRQLKNLKKLYLMSNQLSGPLPAAIGELNELRVLSLTDNTFSGTIPTELNNLKNIEILAIEHERRHQPTRPVNGRRTQQGFGLTGRLPSLEGLPNLQQLLLGYNSLTGSIPYTFLQGIGDKTQPLKVDLEYNLLDGVVPSSLTEFDELQTHLEGNKFSGIAPGLCKMNKWNDGDVESYLCDGILCPLNTYSPIGRQSSEEECIQCPDFTASLYLGSVECISEDEQDEDQEKQILKQLYQSLQGAGWFSQQNWYDEDSSFCTWYGVTCTPGEVNSVEAIRLQDNGLIGHVPSTIFDLPNLQELNLGENMISIDFNGIEKATKLQFLNLDDTGLTTLNGIEAGQSLKFLHLNSNAFKTFPFEVSELSKLEVLDLSHNKFGMNLPDLSTLNNLAYFQCKKCVLSGEIPTWLGTMQSLQYLSLSGNMLTGDIPNELSRLQSLKHLDLSEQTPRGGGITGGLPDFSTLKNLSELYLNRNKLSGEISPAFLQSVDMYSITVDLRYNDLSGAVPDSFVDRFSDLTLLLAENKINSIPNGCDGDSYDDWNNGDVERFGCNALLCPPDYYSPIGRKTRGRDNDCVVCEKNDTDTSEYYGSTTCGIIPDKVALEAIYNSLGGPDWDYNEYWMENDLFCDWYGVICDEDGERVTGLDLEDNNLVGDVPVNIFDLTELNTINVKNNKISFSFEGIEKLLNLESLNLSDLNLHSVEGLRAATSLKVLHLTGNALTLIPEDIYELVNLRELYMNYNKMEGSISSKIGQLTALRELYMFRNKLTGNLPKELGLLKELRTLGLGENSFSGTLPPEMNDLPRVEIIALQHSRASSNSGPGGPLSENRGETIGLTGKVLPFDKSPMLRELYLGYNDLSGLIPTNFLEAADTSDDIVVDLTKNRISGSLPLELKRFEYMTIFLSGNEIASIDQSFCTLKSWMDGDVDKYGCNAILCPTGTSNEYGRQISAGLICQTCPFTFSAPYLGSGECMADLKSYSEKEILEKFYDATGGPGWKDTENWNDDNFSICDWHGIHCMSEDASGGANVVREISLPSNNLVGIIPPQIFDLQYLEVLNIRDNKVDVQLTSVMHVVDVMKAIYLDKTMISSLDGIGKFKNLRTLHLQQNNFAGRPIPEELFTLTNLNRLYISDSNIGGELSSSVGNLVALEDFYSHNNEMTGEIPSEVGLLGNLETLVLSENRFVGPLPDMTNMKSLQSILLDSYTRRSAGLSGPLPSFEDMPSLREIYLNENSLTGTIPHHFLKGIDNVHERVKVGLRGNRIEGSIPRSLGHFQKLDIDLADNLITNIHPDLCENDSWMAGYVESYHCNAILCPAGYYNQFGRQDNALLPCKKCGGDDQSTYLGATRCKAEVKKREREILEIFYDECGGDNWKNKENWLSQGTDICHWYGIGCNDEGSVDSILLGNNNLVGKTPRELFELKDLKWLWLYSNPIDFSFHGIGEASSLTSLLLDATGLTSLDGVGQAYQLVELQARFNRLTGPIPDDLTHLVNLESLSLADNDLTGAIPNFSRLHRLRNLRLGNNKLSGELPSFASNNKLHTVDLSENKITGEIPSDFLGSLSTDEAVYIDLAKNRIEGEVPSELNRFRKVTIYLKDNFITGVHADLCEQDDWNDGDVGKYECDAILCPPGTYAPGRGRESKSSQCLDCNQAKFYGQSECVLRENSASRSTLLFAVFVTLSVCIGMLV